jgi:hypothetical protein
MKSKLAEIPVEISKKSPSEDRAQEMEENDRSSK